MTVVWTGDTSTYRCVHVTVLRDDGVVWWAGRRWLPTRLNSDPIALCRAVRRAIADLEAELREWVAAEERRATKRAAQACVDVCTLADQLPD